MKTRGVIQARMGSERLPGKSLMRVAGTPLLHWAIQSTRSLGFIDELQLATTELAEDSALEQEASSVGLNVFRGDPVDVLGRFVAATQDLSADDNIARITADNPLKHRAACEGLFEHHCLGRFDYSCYRGLSHVAVEIVRVGALRAVATQTGLTDYEREHVTPYLRSHDSEFGVCTLAQADVGLRPDLDSLLTIDTHDDLERFERMVIELSLTPVAPPFAAIYEWLERWRAAR